MGADYDITEADVLAEISDTPEIFNELGREANTFMGRWSPNRDTPLGGVSAHDVLFEVADTPSLFDKLSPEARDFLLRWRQGLTLR
jgi:hypothetical protein